MGCEIPLLSMFYASRCRYIGTGFHIGVSSNVVRSDFYGQCWSLQCVEWMTEDFTLFLCPYIWSFLYKHHDDLKALQSTLSFRANSQDPSCGPASKTPPIPNETQNGQSVENTPNSPQHWFAVRVTHGRARAVYEAITKMQIDCVTPYLPVTKKKVCRIVNGEATIFIEEKPIHTGLLFVNASRVNYYKLLHTAPKIPGLTPFYDHFSVSPTGRNDYLIVPEKQFDSFRRIIESNHEDILTDQYQVPSFLSGKRVRVIDGPFAGVEGTLLKWKHQRRVFVDLGFLGKFATAYIRTCEFEFL